MFFKGRIVNIFKKVTEPILKFFSTQEEAQPKNELTPLGRQLFWEARRKEKLRREQQGRQH